MTFQERDSIFYKRKPYELLSGPGCPETFLVDNKDDPSWGSVCSSNWKGYFVAWEIKDKKLYLKAISGQKKAKVKLPCLFQYTGVVAIPTGKSVEFLEFGSLSLFERELHFEIVKGVVSKTHEVINGMPADLNTKCKHCEKLLYSQGIVDDDGVVSNQKCALCKGPMPSFPKNPKAICKPCTRKAVDKKGRSVHFTNRDDLIGLKDFGGLKGWYDDDSKYESLICYINKRKCKAEALMGMVVLQLVDNKN